MAVKGKTSAAQAALEVASVVPAAELRAALHAKGLDARSLEARRRAAALESDLDDASEMRPSGTWPKSRCTGGVPPGTAGFRLLPARLAEVRDGLELLLDAAELG